MGTILEHIEARRSIRKFTEEPVSHEDLEALLRAGMAAPSASNRRPWQFVAVTDPERLQRLRQGLVLGFTVQDNLTLASFNRFSVQGILQLGRKTELARAMVKSLDIKTPNLNVASRTLSGGNQQKVVVGNWLNTLPEVLLMDEPTRGIDIQAKEQIFNLVRDLARRGLAVVFISSEIEEVLDVADRILIMNQGRITGEVKPDAVDLERLLAMVMEEIAS